MPLGATSSVVTMKSDGLPLRGGLRHLDAAAEHHPAGDSGTSVDERRGLVDGAAQHLADPTAVGPSHPDDRHGDVDREADR